MGPNYVQARRHAQANANRSGRPWWLWMYNGAWWSDRVEEGDAPTNPRELVQPEQKGVDTAPDW